MIEMMRRHELYSIDIIKGVLLSYISVHTSHTPEASRNLAS